MSATTITTRDRELAEGCLRCAACKHARRKQRGLLFWFVSKVEGMLCPQCRAYEKVYGRKAHEKILQTDACVTGEGFGVSTIDN